MDAFGRDMGDQGACLHLFVSTAIKSRSNLNFLQSSDRQVKVTLYWGQRKVAMVSFQCVSKPTHVYFSQLMAILPQVQWSVMISRLTSVA